MFDALALKAPLASPTFTGTVTVPVALTGVLRADTGVVSVDSDVTDIVAAASTILAGKVELATDAETNTGTDTARAITPSNLEAWTGSAQVTTLGTISSGAWDGTDIPVTAGGTGRSTSTTAYGLLAAGTTATGAHQTLAAGATTEILVGGGAAALPVWTTAQGSGAPVRATSPTLTTPNLGTPSAVTLTNATGLPIAGLVASTSTAIGVGSVELGHASDTTLSRSAAGVLAVEGVVIPSISSTNTLTNKRITKRVVTTTDDSTAVIDTDITDEYELTAMANATTFTVTGTPTDGQTLLIRLKDNGTARALTWTMSGGVIGVTLPTTTVISKTS